MSLKYPIIVPESYQNHWVTPVITNEEYHQIKTAISASGLKDFEESAYNFFYKGVLGKGRHVTDSMQFGTDFHTALLEPEMFKLIAVVQPKFAGKGSTAEKLLWTKSLINQSLIFKQEDYDRLQAMLESVGAHGEASMILNDPLTLKEHSGMYRDPATGILCRIRTDFMNFNLKLIGDVKTCQNVTAWNFSQTIFSNSYHLQMYMYSYGCEQITGIKMDMHEFLACSTNPPYECALYTCDEKLLEKGKALYERLMSQLKVCLEENLWPRYQEKNQIIGLPNYAFYE